MYRLILAFIVISLFAPNLFAQKDAPVAGDAAVLIDLLRKDYNALDPESRSDEISRDRIQVISIFKSYLTDALKEKLISPSYVLAGLEVEKGFSKYVSAKKKLTAFSATPPAPTDETELGLYAEKLKEISRDVDREKLYYYKQKSKLDDIEISSIASSYESLKNNYLKTILNKFKSKYDDLSSGGIDRFSATSSSVTVQKSNFGLVGDLTYQMVVGALSEIIATRIEQELSMLAIKKIQDWLNNPGQNDPFAEFKILLPQTTSYFVKHSDGVFQAKQLREHIEDDLRQLLAHAENLRNTPRMQRFLNKFPEMEFALEGLKVYSNLSGTKSPADYFTVLEHAQIIQKLSADVKLKENLKNSIALMTLLARSLSMVENGESRLVGLEFISNNSSDTNFYLLYLGFLSQQNLKYYNIFFQNSTTTFLLSDYFESVMANSSKIEDHKKEFENVLSITAKNTEKVYKFASTIRKVSKSEKALMPDSLHAFIESVIDMGEDMFKASQEVINLVNNYKVKNGNSSETFQGNITSLSSYFRIARRTNDVSRDLQKKKYSSAVNKTLGFYLELETQENPAFIDDIIDMQLNVGTNEPIKNWAVSIKAMVSKTRLSEFNKGESEALAEIRPELTRMNIYAKSRPEVIGLNAFISNLIALADANSQTGQAAFSDDLKQFLTKEEFRNFMMQYYLQQDVAGNINRAVTILAKFTVKNGATDVPVFETAEIDAFKALLTDYYNAFFDNYFKNGLNDEGIVLIDIKKKLRGKIKTFSVVFGDNLVVNNPQASKVIRLVIELSMANDEKEVKLALNNFINKTGSYSDKRVAKFNVSINAYPGVLPSYEMAWKPSQVAKAFSVGFTAPVGLSFSWGSRRGTSDGFFVPVIDIGALTRVRLDSSNEDKALPALEFKNIFAPGLYYTHGFKNSPLGINIGAQYGPDLKEVTYDTSGSAITKSYESLRVGIALVLDIPLFGFTNKPR